VHLLVNYYGVGKALVCEEHVLIIKTRKIP